MEKGREMKNFQASLLQVCDKDRLNKSITDEINHWNNHYFI